MRRTAAALMTAIAAALAFAGPALAAFPGQNGRFVYAQDPGIWTANPDGSQRFQVTTPSGSTDRNPTWSADGQRIAFERFSTNPNQWDLYVVNADGTGLANVTQTPANDEFDASWSPDGSKLVFFRCCWTISKINVDGTGLTTVATPPPNILYRRPKWSPDGTKIAFKCGPFNNEHDICSVNADGTGLMNLTNTPMFTENNYDWSPDGTKIVFDGYPPNDPSASTDVYVMNRDGTGRANLTSSPGQYDGAPLVWAPNGAILFASSRLPEGLYLTSANGSSVTWYEFTLNLSDWQAAPAAAPAGIARPKGASPLRVSLVPAFQKCNAPDSTHGAPLAYPSCLGPRKISQYLTMGTPDQNGRPAKAIDSISLIATPGDPATTANEADVKLNATITDVRGDNPGVNTFPDYLAELRVLMTVRLTQRIELSTTADFPFDWTVPCTGTADTTVGSTCAITTSVNTLVPGAVLERYRAIWQLGQIQVQDGGEDGVGATEGDNTLYLKQGMFVP
jgi:WD40-like Beta Propeller Repeat